MATVTATPQGNRLRRAARRWAEQARRLLGGAPAEIQAAALPWRRTNGKVEILLVTSRQTGRWIIPKGWVDPGEPLHLAARREAFEEAGIEGTIASDPLGSYFYMKALPSGLMRRCEVWVFPLHVSAEAKRWPERELRHRSWLSPQDASRRIQDAPLAELIAGFQGIAGD